AESSAARELVEQEDAQEKVCSGAAVLLGNARPHQSQLGELREDLSREAMLAVPIRGVRLALLTGEVARQALYLELLGRRLEIHAEDYIDELSDVVGSRR